MPSPKERQIKSTQKKAESGLVLTKLYLDREVLKQLEKIAKDLGYQNFQPKSGKRSETLSKVITGLISRYSRPYQGENSKHKQELFFFRRIIKFRKNKFHESNLQIAEFLKAYKYLKPESIRSPTKRHNPKYDWKTSDIEKLLNKETFQELLKPTNSTLQAPSSYASNKITSHHQDDDWREDENDDEEDDENDDDDWGEDEDDENDDDLGEELISNAKNSFAYKRKRVKT